MKTNKLFLVTSILLVAIFALGVGVAQAGTLNPSFTDFEETGFVTGASVNDLAPDGTFVNISNINNCVQAWRIGGSSPTTEDEEIVDLSPDSHGKVWRLSQGGVMGSLGAAPHSPNNGNVTPLIAGELNPAGGHFVHNDAGCGQPTTNHFYGEMEFKSVTENPVEMSLSVVPSSHDQRHGYVRFLDDGMGSGLDLQFYDTVGNAFNSIILDLNISYNEWHTLGIGIDFVDDLESGVLGDADAIGNDIVKVFLDGEVVHCGTSWESYYASVSNDDRRIQSVDRLMFSGGLVEEQLGGGMYFDNVLVSDEIPSGSCPSDNLPPVADANGPYLVAVEQSVTLDGSGSSDPDGDLLTETWMETGVPSLGSIVGSTFTAGTDAGITEVLLTVDDGRGGTDTDTAMLVVYDPDGGFVTGGGWIDSPAEAMAPTQMLVWDQDFSVDDSGWLDNDDAWYGDIAVSGGTATFYGDSDSAPFSRFDGYRDVWPGTWTAEIDVYLDPSWPSGQGFDYSVAANGSDGNHQRDYIFHVGVVEDYDPITGRALLVNGSNNTDFYTNPYKLVNENGGNYYNVTTAGWYTLQHVFRDAGGYLAVDLNLLDAGGNILWTVTRENVADTILGEVGGNRYAWFTHIDVADGVQVDNHQLFVPVSPTGKATFGFVSKYKKGASVPTGNTEFQFKAGDLNFHSTEYQWLVINQGGTNAQFKGYGTINGTGDYGFMLWATDGSLDEFRIKIWDAVSEDVVYDNGPDQAIGGGSIVVHKK